MAWYQKTEWRKYVKHYLSKDCTVHKIMSCSVNEILVSLVGENVKQKPRFLHNILISAAAMDYLKRKPARALHGPTYIVII